MSPSFFQGFSGGAMAGALADFHKAGGQSPKTMAWLNGSAAEQYLITPYWNSTHHIARIKVVHRSAAIAHMALTRIVRRDA
jgi:hypothetical protein